ncbi:MAG: methyltransferase [Alphaproteobacteria bacterium]|nr:methyltransferase [Alphaproteobacteria bacterium]
MRVLDLGCGTGVVGLACQRAGARVVAVDVEPAAVAAARENGLDDVCQGDLFGPIADQRFDLVAFNPPYLAGSIGGRGAARRALGRSLYGGPGLEVVRRFAQDLPAALAEGGQALMCWSDRAPETPAALLGPAWRIVAEERLADEVLTVWSPAQ